MISQLSLQRKAIAIVKDSEGNELQKQERKIHRERRLE